jgi:hypothetical protein
MAIGQETLEHVLHDSNEPAIYGCGFIPDADGSFEGRSIDDTADRTFNVKGGAVYPISIKLAKSTGAVGVSELLIIQCG